MENGLKLTHRILLGLLMLVPGLMKLFVAGSTAISGMLSGIALFSWAPLFWAWVLILSEIIFGAAILANYKLKYTTIPPMIILAVALLFVNFSISRIGDPTMWPGVFLHLVAITGYAILMKSSKAR